MSTPTTLSEALDYNSGYAQLQSGTSFATFFTSVVASVILFAVQVIAFILFRRFGRGWSKRLYEPRTYLVTKRRQTVPLGKTLVSWMVHFLKIEDEYLYEKCGIDAYLFLRYLKVMSVLFLSFVFICTILLPINATGGGSSLGMDILSISNISGDDSSKLWAHVVISYIFFPFVVAIITLELRFYIGFKQSHLMRSSHVLAASSSTILISMINSSNMNEESLNKLFSKFPGGIKRIWLNRDYTKLENRIDERNYFLELLENSEASKIKSIILEHSKEVKRLSKGKSVDGNTKDIEKSADIENDLVADIYERKKKPHVRLPIFSFWRFSLPLIGRKVEAVEWCMERIDTLNSEIEELQNDENQFGYLNSAFIQFNSQIGAHMAAQSVINKSVLNMSLRTVEVVPSQIVWWNLRIKIWERYLRLAASSAIVTALILLWVIPVAFVGLLSQITYLVDTFPWLGWIESLPAFVIGIITGVLPALLLSAILSVLPIVLRLMARISGAFTLAEAESISQEMYFAFLFIQVFLVVSISSGLTSVAVDIYNSPASVATILAQNLPNASNFFFSYILIRGLAMSASELLCISYIIKYSFHRLLSFTPRERFRLQLLLKPTHWGSLYPVFTNIACIGIIYSIVSPLIMVICSISFLLLRYAYKYTMLYVHEVSSEFGGAQYPKSLYQLFTGIYVGELCLIGLFFLTQNSEGQLTAIPQGVFMIVLLSLTIVYNILLCKHFNAHLKFLPLSSAVEVPEKDERHTSRNIIHNAAPFSALSILRPFKRKINQGFYLDKLRSPTLTGSSLTGDDSVEDILANKELLFSDVPDDIFDLSEEDRNRVIEYAYKNPAIKSRTPIIWIPKDNLGVADFEVMNANSKWKYLKISDENASITKKGKIRFAKAPPDYYPDDKIE